MVSTILTNLQSHMLRASANKMGCYEHFVPVSDWEIGIGIVSICISSCIGLPQIYKIYRLRSSKSISFWTLTLSNIGAQFYVLNIFILHYNQIKRGLTGTYQEWKDSQRSIMMLYLEFCNMVSYAAIYPVAMKFMRVRPYTLCGWQTNTKNMAYIGLYIQAVVVVGAWLPVMMMVFGSGKCGPYNEYAQFAGLMLSIIGAVKFIPQVYKSWFAKGSHALSYITVGGDMIAGGVGVWEKIFFTHERQSTWVPPLIGHFLELVIVVTNLYHDIFSPNKSSSPPPPLAHTLPSEEGLPPSGYSPIGDRRRSSSGSYIPYNASVLGRFVEPGDEDLDAPLLSYVDAEEQSRVVGETEGEVFVDGEPVLQSTTALGRFLDRFL